MAFEFDCPIAGEGGSGRWLLDSESFRLSRAGEEVRIEPKVFDFLVLLVANRDRVMSKTELLDTLWPNEHVSDAVLPRCVAAARKLFGDSRSLQAVIQTVHGRGYRFVAETREVAEQRSSIARAAVTEAAPDGPFVGRDRIIVSLRSALEDTIAGRGRLCLLVGEPGIGKTRTSDELIAEARQRGASSSVGHCIEGEGAPAYWPWLQILRALAAEREGDAIVAELGDAAAEILNPGANPTIASSTAGDNARFRMFYRISRALREAARQLPRVIVLDDLHWADTPSLQLLRFVSQELADSAVLIVGTYRDVELRRGHPLASLLGELTRLPRFQRLLLRGLELPDIESYLEQVVGRQAPAGLAAAIHELTEGNPFFVGEIVRWLESRDELDGPDETESDALESDVDRPSGSRWSLTLPQGAREAVGRRLDGLSDACNEALQVASIQGRSFDLSTTQRVLEIDRGSLLARLDEAVSARILRAVPDDPGRYEFAHAIVQQTVYEELSLPMRVRLHERTGEEIEALHTGDPESVAESLAHHFFQAAAGGDTARALEHCQRAARRAARLLAYEQAVVHYRRALQVLDLSSETQGRAVLRCELMLALGDEQSRCAERDAARQTFSKAAELAKGLDRADLFARAALGVGGRAELGTGSDPELRDLLDEAMAGLDESEVVLRSRLFSRMVGVPPHSYSMAKRKQLSEQARALAAQTEDFDTHVHALAARHWALLGPDHVDERMALGDEALALSQRFRASGSGFLSQDAAMVGHEARLGALLLRGEVAAADLEIDATLARADALREPLYRWFAHWWRTSRAISDGHYDIATTLVGQGLHFADHASHPLSAVVYRGLELWMNVTRGDWAQLYPSMDILEWNRGALGPLVQACLANLAVSEGRPEDARALIDQVASNDFRDMERGEFWLFTVGLLSELFWDLDDRQRAGQLFEQVRPYAGLNSVLDILRVHDGAVAGYLAKLAVTLGRDDEARHYYRAASAMNERMHARPAIAGTLYYEARWLFERGLERDRAFEVLDTAEQLASELGRSRRLEELRALRARYA